jgi:hypothetical protein
VCHVQWLNSYRQQGEGHRHCCVCSSTAPADSCLVGHIAVLTRACHCTPFWASVIQATPSYHIQVPFQYYCPVNSKVPPLDSSLKVFGWNASVHFLYFPFAQKCPSPLGPLPKALNLSPYNTWQNVRFVQTFSRFRILFRNPAMFTAGSCGFRKSLHVNAGMLP